MGSGETVAGHEGAAHGAQKKHCIFVAVDNQRPMVKICKSQSGQPERAGSGWDIFVWPCPFSDGAAQ